MHIFDISNFKIIYLKNNDIIIFQNNKLFDLSWLVPNYYIIYKYILIYFIIYYNNIKNLFL